MITDLRFAFRQLTKSPGFTIVAILALALGIGANTAIFSVISSVFLRPLPYTEPDRLVQLRSTDTEHDLIRIPFSYPRFLAVQERQEVFSDMAIGAFNGFTVTGRGDPQQVNGFHASANYLSILGVQPFLGRNFNAEENARGGAQVVMISHQFWRQQFNSDPAVLGQPLTIDNVPHTIIGVLPAALSTFPLNEVGLWLPRPVEVNYLVPAQLDNGSFSFNVIGRLMDGVTLERARQNLEVIAAAYRADHPKNVDAPSIIVADPVLEGLVGEQQKTYTLLFAAVGCVLLIACANVANLMLARFSGRRKEIALRFALGANRAHIVRQLLVESLLVALAGGALGILFARWSLDGVLAVGGELIPRALEIAIDPRALAFTFVASLATGLAIGLLPAMQASGVDVNDALKDSTRGSSSAGHGRLRNGLLIGEIALSLVLLIAAGLLLTSFARLQRVSAGFNPDGVLVGFLNIPNTKYPPGPALVTFYNQLFERMRTIPGVQSAALTDRVPLTGNTTPAPVAVSGRPVQSMAEQASANRHLVSPDFFKTVGMPLLQGRDFNERDTPTSPHVVIVNEAFVRQHFPGENPIGRTLVTGMAQMPSEIVGIVGDIRATNLDTPPAPDYFLPALQRPEAFTSILLRLAAPEPGAGGTERDPAGLTATLRAALREVDPDIPLLDPQPLTTLVANTVADRRLAMTMLGGFAGLALVLASIGVYSVMAYVVSQRTAEIGIRMALGATPQSVLRMVLAQGVRLAAIGIVIGVAVALAVTRLMQRALFEVQPHDPGIYIGLAALILAVAFIACWIPARRATRVDPITALRAE
ncbi:MAG TPA: ABC transporter permease [Opitutaceae bacterium]|nr:ABC transporter permease [Opitutaceae bacterium]